MPRDQNIFKDRHLLEQSDVLEGAGDPELRDLVGCLGDDLVIGHRLISEIKLLHLASRIVFYDRFTVEIYDAVCRLVYTGDHVEGRRLSRAVRADQCDDLALIDLHGEVIYGNNTAELHGDMFQAEYIRIRITHLRKPPFPFGQAVSSVPRSRIHGRP